MDMVKKPKILLIATGGTIASQIFENGLAPGLEASQLLSYIPEISGKYEIDAVQVSNIDSTNMTPSHWVKIVETVRDSYDRYDSRDRRYDGRGYDRYDDRYGSRRDDRYDSRRGRRDWDDRDY